MCAVTEKGTFDSQVTIAPSILSADFGNLAQTVADLVEVTNWLHIDVMDGHFVPNITVGPCVVQSLRKYSSMYFDCHLMIENPGKYLEAFRDAGANSCTVHIEVGDTENLIAQMRSLGLSVGLAANPQTPFFLLEDWLDKIDLLLLMTVHPGFAGQHFIQEVIEKVGVARSFIDSNNLHCDLQVDGGIDIQTAPGAVQAGARVLVAGTAVFSYGDESKNKTQDAAKAVIDLKNAAIGALTGQLNS